MNKRLMPRMIALVVVVVVGVYYIAFDIMQYRLFSRPFVVTVLMPSAGGLYTGADVTYRGVQVGTVGALDVQPDQLAVKLDIDAGEHIPDNGPVRVKELSALGEQYIDFQPTHGDGPDLRTGTVIPAKRVVLPTSIGTTLIDLGKMLKSINTHDLVVNENFLATAFNGTGSDLRTIIVSGERLFNALVAAQPETVNLVLDGQTDLHTLEATDGDLATFSAGLSSLTQELADSNTSLRALIKNSNAAEIKLNPLLASDSASIDALVATSATDSQVSAAYAPQVDAIFELLPAVSDDLASVASNGHIHGVLEVNTADPVCPYVLGTQMPGPTQSVSSPSLTNNCPTSSPGMLQRGADSTPTYRGG